MTDTLTPERAVIDTLKPLVTAAVPTATLGVGVPSSWTPKSPIHVQVAQDSPITATPARQVAGWALMRVTVWTQDTDRSQQLAMSLWQQLLSHDGTPPVSKVLPGAGPMPALDPDTKAELATFVVNIRIRFSI